VAALASGVPAGEALQQALKSAPPGESGRDRELLKNVRNYMTQRPASREAKSAGLPWDADFDTESLVGTDANDARLGGLKEQVSKSISQYLHEFSSIMQQRAWLSPKAMTITPIMAHVRGDFGGSLVPILISL